MMRFKERRKKRATTHAGQKRLKEGRIISDKQTNDDIHSRMISYELLMIRARQTELMENGSLNLKFCGWTFCTYSARKLGAGGQGEGYKRLTKHLGRSNTKRRTPVNAEKAKCYRRTDGPSDGLSDQHSGFCSLEEISKQSFLDIQRMSDKTQLKGADGLARSHQMLLTW